VFSVKLQSFYPSHVERDGAKWIKANTFGFYLHMIPKLHFESKF